MHVDEHPEVDEGRVEDKKEVDGLLVDRVCREDDEQGLKDEAVENNNGVRVDELQQENVDENAGNIQVGNQPEGEEHNLGIEEQKQKFVELQDKDKRYKVRDLKVLSEREDAERIVNVQQKLDDKGDDL